MEGPGVAAYQNDELDDAVEKFTKARDVAQTAKDRHQAAEDSLKMLLHDHADKIGIDKNGEIVYRCDDEVVILKPGKEKLTVKAAPEAP